MHPVVFFLAFQNNIKLYHWMTKSYSSHIAADKLYENIIELGDRFVEVYIGKFSRPTLNKKDLAIYMNNLDDKSVFAYLDKSLEYLTKDIYKYISEKDADLIDIINTLIAEINQTKYMLSLKN